MASSSANYSKGSSKDDDDEKSGIPRWDGNAAGWEEYQQRARWYVRGTKKEDLAAVQGTVRAGQFAEAKPGGQHMVTLAISFYDSKPVLFLTTVCGIVCCGRLCI